jgi:hypothetical protein
MTLTAEPRYCRLGRAWRPLKTSEGLPAAPRPRRHWGTFCFLLLATALLFCHGCHGDTDDELGLFWHRQAATQQEQPR